MKCCYIRFSASAVSGIVFEMSVPVAVVMRTAIIPLPGGSKGMLVRPCEYSHFSASIVAGEPPTRDDPVQMRMMDERLDRRGAR